MIQFAKHRDFLRLIPDMELERQMKHKKEKGREVFKTINEDGTNPQLLRVVMNIEGADRSLMSDKQLLIDAIEVNQRMYNSPESVPINEMSEVFIFFGLATLYAAACPIAAFIILLHTVFFMKAKLYVMYMCIRRQLPETKQNIGPWLSIANFMAIMTVISNTFLLYFSSNRFRSLFQSDFGVNSDFMLLAIIIGIEHGIIIFKFLLEAVIKDRPTWVDKSQ